MSNYSTTILALFFLSYSQLVLPDDTELFIGGSNFAPDPKVLFLMDNSTSMTATDGDSQTRMSEAKEILIDIVHNPDNSELDIGVAALSRNYHGGKIVAAIKDLSGGYRGNKPTFSPSSHGSCSPTQTNTLTQKICDIQAKGHTQLEETYWESYLYFMGKNQRFGSISDTYLTTDSLALASGSYFSPIFEDSSLLTDINDDGNLSISSDLSCQTNYIVLMTDGQPGSDDEANSDIKALTGNNCSGSGKCMDELSEYMFENDLDSDSSNDKQNIVTYTVGFHISSGSSADKLLSAIAEKGGGEAFLGSDATKLSEALNTIFSNISNASATFTSPSTANAASNDARSLDYIYTTAFKPSQTPNWFGNLKKYRLDTVQTGFEADGTTPKYEFKVVDKNNKVVYDSNGQIISTANGGSYNVQSLWSSVADTDQVTLGGAGASITSHSSRIIYTNSDDDTDPNTVDVLTKFTNSNSYLNNAHFDAVSTTEKNNIIAWARGDDQSGSTRWVFNDPLHSQPAIINYGKRNNQSKYSGIFSDIRVAIATNGGFVHFLTDDIGGVGNSSSSGHSTGDTVSEQWAFIPTIPSTNTPMKNLKTLKTNLSGKKHPYGIDGTIAIFMDDKNRDGNICTAALDCNGDSRKDGDLNGDGDTSDEGEGDDQVVIVFGMRRGGYYYYAIDVTDPEKPVFLWKYSPTSLEIQQSWSTPQFAKVKYFDGTDIQIKSVAIFAAGYDSNKDASPSTLGTDDSFGRGLFILDINTGEVIWSILNGSSASSTATTLYEPTLRDSIPADVKIMDINDDGILERIYMSDTGGNIWRVDLFNQDVSSAYKTSPLPVNNSRGSLNLYTKDSRLFWSIYKLARLGRGDTANLSNDRRFFNQINAFQTRDDKGSFDALLFGSGHRNHPNDVDTLNRFYMIKDLNINSYKFALSCETDIASQDYDSSCKESPGALINSSLVDVTSTVLTTASDFGWRLDLEAKGEKSLSPSVTINGVVAFNTFSPTINAISACTPQAGTNYFYAIDLHTGGASIDFNKNGTIDPIIDRKVAVAQASGGIPGKPSVVVPEGGDDIFISPSPGGPVIGPGDNSKLKARTSIYFQFKNKD